MEIITANKNYIELTELFEDLKIDGMKIQNGLIQFNSSTKSDNKNQNSPGFNQIIKETNPHKKHGYDERVFHHESFKRPEITTQKNISGIKWESKLASILGYNAETEEYEHEIFEKAGITEMFIYCDIVELQRVGGEHVPLLKKMSYDGENGKIIMREFIHNQYKDVIKNEIDSIRTYIRCENGLPTPLRFGNFSATLHFKAI